MAIHSSILAWEIPWTGEPNGLQSVGLQRVNMTEHACIDIRFRQPRSEVPALQQISTVHDLGQTTLILLASFFQQHLLTLYLCGTFW